MRRMVGILIGAATLATGLAGTANADRCEADELVVRLVVPGYEDPIAEDDSPVCHVLLNYGWYYVCDDGEPPGPSCDVDVDPTRPFPGLADYHPEPGRVFCAAYSTVAAASGRPEMWAACTWSPIWRD